MKHRISVILLIVGVMCLPMRFLPPALAQEPLSPAPQVESGKATTGSADHRGQAAPKAAWSRPQQDAGPSATRLIGGEWWRALAHLQHKLQSGLVSAIRGLKAGEALISSAALMGIAFLYGVFHAIGPGHGKTVISSYVLADAATLRRGIMLSFLASVVQALSAITLVCVVVILFRGAGVDIRQMVQRFETVSGLMIFLAGLWLLFLHGRRRLAEARPAMMAFQGGGALSADHGHHHHGYGHHHHHGHHDHDENCGCGHAHMPDPQQVERAGSVREAAAIVLAVGIRPCTGAILLLVFALQQGLFWAGLVGTFAMSLGTAITVSALASLAVGAREAATRFAANRWMAGIYDFAAIVGALLVAAIGLSLFLEALGPAKPF